MKLQIKKFSELTGVSVRTLHYYDEIGLLKPAAVETHSGYRFYDENSVVRMQEILFYRELDFPLKSICHILSSPNYDKERALLEQKKLLTLKKERLERLIAAVDDAVKGEMIMDAFANTEFEQYKAEVKEKWGQTNAYAEYAERSKGRTKENANALAEGMELIFAQFALCMQNGDPVTSNDAQALVKKLQAYITGNFYTCTREILAGLGKMYVADKRFQNNIDKHASGTAEYTSKAIAYYCSAEQIF